MRKLRTKFCFVIFMVVVVVAVAIVCCLSWFCFVGFEAGLI